MIFHLTFFIPTPIIKTCKMTHHTRNKNNKEAGLKVLQWNCQGARDKLPILQTIAPKYDIVCLQETLLAENSQFNMKDFFIIRNDITGPKMQGICTLINRTVSYTQIILQDYIQIHPPVEIQAISIKNNTASFILVHLYRHPSANTPAAFFNNLIAFCNSYTSFLIVGDFNAHYAQWFNAYEDKMGKIISQITNTHGLVILNDGRPTLFSNTHRIHTNIVIDLAIASANFAPYCSTCTLDDCFGSDHFPISTHLCGNFIPRKRFVYKYILKPSHFIKCDLQK